MAFYVKLYDHAAETQFLGVIEDADVDHFHAVGILGSDAGIFTKTDAEGAAVFTRQYNVSRETINLKTGVKADNGDFLLHGSMVMGVARHRSLVIRTDRLGNVLWSRVYYQEVTRDNIRLIKSIRDEYYLSSWAEVGHADNSVEVIKIDGLGNVIKSVNIPTKSIGGQRHDIKPFGGGLILHGGSRAVSGYETFIMELSSGLSVSWARQITSTRFPHIKDIIQIDADRFIMTGDADDRNKTFIFQFDKRLTSHSAFTYDLVPGATEKCFRRMIKTDTAYYVIHRISTEQKSYVTKFGLGFDMIWMKEFSMERLVYLNGILSDGGAADELFMLGGHVQSSPLEYEGIFLRTDGDLNSCATISHPVPRSVRTTFTSMSWLVIPKNIEITVIDPRATMRSITLTEERICPKGLEIGGNPVFQSPYTYLEAAGSDESDDSVRGFHLRWDFLRKLGETHLPKGDYSIPTGDYPTSIGFNREDDYVRIYKTTFENQYAVQIDFEMVPDVINDTGLVREWVYENLVPIAGIPTHTTNVVLRFLSLGDYAIAKSIANPATNPLDFIEKYKGQIEIQTEDKLMFYADFTLVSPGTGSLRMEAVAIQDPLDESTRQVACRKTLTSAASDPIYCDNLEFIRFDYTLNGHPAQIKLIAYDDYISGVSHEDQWTLIKKFALDDGNADGNAEVFKRLEDSANYTVDGAWRKYNEPDVGTLGEFRVKTENYEQRWLMPEGLKYAVETYLEASRTDLKAVVTHDNEDLMDNDAQMDVSYLDMLNFVSLDYHAARMVGLGHIDHDEDTDADTRFVYLMEYVTEAALEDGDPPALVSHYYMAPPLTIMDHKLPPAPVQKEISYGVYGDNKTGTPTLLTTPDGYNPYGAARYVNIHREQFNFELPFGAFYASTDEYCLCAESRAVLFGLEYADDDIAAGNPFIRPEISHDPTWTDPGGLPEVSPIPNSGNDLVYVHEETNPGIHHYALYSINWFSRVSPIGNKKETDETIFPKVNTLLPPSNLAVQLIQKENPRIFTSQAEQDHLLTITDPDKTYVRVTFDWNQMHNQAYDTATGVELFWRENEPLIVQGEIAAVISEDASERTVTVSTTSYYNASVDQTITPVVAALDESKFIGARMTLNGDQFVIDSFITTGTNPTIKLKQIRQTASQDVSNDNIFCTTEIWMSPAEGERFLMTENLDNVASWDTQLVTEISIEQFSSHTESVTYEDGSTTVFNVGGLTGGGTVEDVPDPEPGIVTDHVPMGGPAEVPTGVYTITFDTELLPAHPNLDPSAVVDYIGGTVRVHDVNGDVKTLNVWKIEESTGGTTELTAYDPTFGLVRDVNGDFVLTALEFTPIPGYVPIETGSVTFINFHPSYRIYLEKGTGMSPFIESNILPDSGDGTKNTFVAARSIDTVESCESYMTVPAVLLAREIIEPVAPGVPTGPLFATRPNFYGKATYTFDVEVENPFSLIFYRSNEQKLLDQLYTPDKVEEILTALSGLESPDADFFQDRWFDLVNMNYDPVTFTFKEYTVGGYRFPMPNNGNYKIPHANPILDEAPFAASFTFNDSYTYTDPDEGLTTVTMVKLVTDAIQGAFLPLTEIPPVYGQLREEPPFQTSGKKPVLRDPETGSRLLPDHGLYDPWPMAIRFEKNGLDEILQAGDMGYGDPGNTKFVRFTDYSLDGAAKNFYFYFGVEMTATLAVSEASTTTGPIQLVNSEPTVAPKIQKITTQLEKRIDRIPTAVRFSINDYLETDGIEKIQVYRTNVPGDALTVRTMDLVQTLDYGVDLMDDFSDQLFPLYGDPLFYRLVALRQIVNEQEEVEYIPSQPSNVALTNVVDNQTPPPPTLRVTHNAPTGAPPQIDNVKISFGQTTYNGTYFLYMEGADGNWRMIKQWTPADHLNTPEISVFLTDTDHGTGTLPKQDANLNPIYYRFRVDLENSSGIPNQSKKEVTI